MAMKKYPFSIGDKVQVREATYHRLVAGVTYEIVDNSTSSVAVYYLEDPVTKLWQAVTGEDIISVGDLKETRLKLGDIVETTYGEQLKQIVDLRYWGDRNECYEWEEIVDKRYYSRSKVLRKRNNLVDETAARIGWV